MTPEETLKALEEAGTPQNRKVYARHGVRENMFGVSFKELHRLAKKIRTDHELARALWASGNHDAAVLAAMIADGDTVTVAELDSWARDLDSYVIADALATFASRTPHAASRVDKWTKAKGEWVARAGWGVLARIVEDEEAMPAKALLEKIATIETDIHAAPNRVRDAMNMALIATAQRGGAIEEKAIAAARRIGKVEVDHGETGCKTPDALEYIEKMKSYRAQRERNVGRASPGRSGAQSSAKKSSATKTGAKKASGKKPSAGRAAGKHPAGKKAAGKKAPSRTGSGRTGSGSGRKPSRRK
ncbi:MAG: DNA alkylation repair protein [Gemmatimonadetes bacterium]|nr:DNA alkylation repair protein [Gemmatimonadota bacterium]